MTPAQTALDILTTIPDGVQVGDHTQQVSTRTMSVLRDAVRNSVEEERLLHGLLHRLRPLAESHYARMQGEAQTNPNNVTEHWASAAREMVHSLNARLGVQDD
jgi:anaerobic glycerol-3-phosphate dehydrogenase